MGHIQAKVMVYEFIFVLFEKFQRLSKFAPTFSQEISQFTLILRRIKDDENQRSNKNVLFKIIIKLFIFYLFCIFYSLVFKTFHRYSFTASWQYLAIMCLAHN